MKNLQYIIQEKLNNNSCIFLEKLNNNNGIFLEKLKLNKDTQVLLHEDEYFPFNCIGKENECYSIKSHGNASYQAFSMLSFRNNLMAIFKQTKYKNILFSVTYTDTNETFYVTPRSIEKRGYIDWLFFKIDNKDQPASSFICQNFYTVIQNKISNPNYLNSNCFINIIPYVIKPIYKNMHISWLDNYKCIAINFECEKAK